MLPLGVNAASAPIIESSASSGYALELLFGGADNSTTFTDTSSFGRTMTRVGSPVVKAGTGPSGANCGDFLTSAGNYLTTPDAAELRFGAGDFEISCDFKLQSTIVTGGKHSFIASKGASGNLNNAWYFGIFSGGYISFTSANNNAAIYVLYDHRADTTNWHNLKLRRTSGLVEILVDDVSVGSCTPGSGGVANIYEGAAPLYVKGWNYGTANTRGDLMANFRMTCNP